MSGCERVDNESESERQSHPRDGWVLRRRRALVEADLHDRRARIAL